MAVWSRALRQHFNRAQRGNPRTLQFEPEKGLSVPESPRGSARKCGSGRAGTIRKTDAALIESRSGSDGLFKSLLTA